MIWPIDPQESLAIVAWVDLMRGNDMGVLSGVLWDRKGRVRGRVKPAAIWESVNVHGGPGVDWI